MASNISQIHVVITYLVPSVASNYKLCIYVINAGWDESEMHLATYLMLLISLTLYGQQVLPCCEPVTTVE